MIALSIYKTSFWYYLIHMPYLQYMVAFGNKFTSSFVCKPMYVIVLMNVLMRKVILAVVKFLVIVYL